MTQFVKSNKTMSANLKEFDPGDYSRTVFYIPHNIDLSWNYVGPGDFWPGGIDHLLDRVRGNIQNNTDVVVLWGAPNRLHLYPECVDRINQFAESIPNTVVLFNGNYSAKDTSRLRCGYSEFAYFEHIVRSTWSQCDIAAPRSKQFTMIGTKDYPTRKYLLSQIVEHGVDSNAYISYKQINTGAITVGNYSQEEIDHIVDVANRVDSRLPWPVLDNSIEFPQLPRQVLLDSYVNMITDTYFEGDIFVSEKVYTAIAHGQMFVMLAPAGTLAYLRSRGYQTFGDHIDESYDQIENNWQRLQAVAQILITLAESDLADLYARCRHIVQHNHHLFYTRDTQAEFVAKIQHFSG
jgi:hypothetical protein